MEGDGGEKGRAATSFEDLHIFQRARELTNTVYSLTRRASFSRDRGLMDQIRRASVSVMSNIAEGFERGAKAEFIQFLYIAKGSCGEVRAQLQVARDQRYLEEADYMSARDLARRASGMISNFIAHLQKTEYQGEKFSRVRRQHVEAQQERIDALRASQLASMRAREEREKKGSV